MIYLLDRNQIISHSVNKSERHPALSEIAKFISLSIFSDEYVGCYKDTANRDLDGELINFPLDNTPHKCISLCKDKGKHTYTI